MPSPVTKDWLERPRLAEPLDAPTRLVVVAGPHGSGVTTLLQQWAARQDGAVVLDARTAAIRGASPDASALVIDDAERLDGEGWAALVSLIEERPSLLLRLGMHSCQLVPSELTATFVRDLWFTPDELVELVAATGAAVEPRPLYLATTGFPAAVSAVLASGVTRPDRLRGVLAEGGGAPLAGGQARLAVPDALTPALVAELGGGPDFLEVSEREGLGTWSPGAAGRVFVLSPLVRAATLARYPISGPERGRVRGRAGEALLAEGAWIEAVGEGRRSGRLDLVDAALRRGAMPFVIAHGRRLSWELAAIPLLQLRRWPVIAMAAAIIANARQQHAVRAGQLMGIAILGAARSPSGSSERALLRTIETVARRIAHVGDGGVKAADAALRIIDGMTLDELHEIEALLGDIRVHSGISLLYGGRIDDARVQFELAAAGPSRLGVELLALGGAALVHALEGDIAGAERWIAVAEARPWPARLLDDYAGSMLRIAQAIVGIERGALEAAAGYLEVISPMIDTIEHWPLVAYTQAILDVRRGRASHGLEELRLLRARRGRRITPSGTSARLLDLAAATLALGAGDLVGASALQPSTSEEPAFISLALARVAVFAGDDQGALRHLRTVEARTLIDRLNHMLLHAIVLRRGGQREEAVLLARRAGALADATGLTTPLALLPADERDLFTEEATPVPDGLPRLETVPRLTERERIVLHELRRTARLDEIAARLHVSANTVKSQRRSLYRKLGAASRDEALARAAAHGLVERPGGTQRSK